MKQAMVLGAGGFIGSHLVERLKKEGYWVRGVDLKHPDFIQTAADDFVVADLRDQTTLTNVFDRPFDEIYQLAADMGGAGYIFTGESDAEIMYNSAMINLNSLEAARKCGAKGLLFTSSACVYPQENQLDPDNPICTEDSAYPADPDSDYGWEKLFGERMYQAYQRNHNMNTKLGRLHGVFGWKGTWEGGREKAPAAICRKVAEAENGSSIEIWGDGLQTRSFLFVDEGVEALFRLMQSDYHDPVNVGSEEMISINDFARMVIEISGKELSINNIPGPLGVRGRNSDNTLINEVLGWKPSRPLREGVEKTYNWVLEQVEAKQTSSAA